MTWLWRLATWWRTKKHQPDLVERYRAVWAIGNDEIRGERDDDEEANQTRVDGVPERTAGIYRAAATE